MSLSLKLKVIEAITSSCDFHESHFFQILEHCFHCSSVRNGWKESVPEFFAIDGDNWQLSQFDLVANNGNTKKQNLGLRIASAVVTTLLLSLHPQIDSILAADFPDQISRSKWLLCPNFCHGKMLGVPVPIVRILQRWIGQFSPNL